MATKNTLIAMIRRVFNAAKYCLLSETALFSLTLAAFDIPATVAKFVIA